MGKILLSKEEDVTVDKLGVNNLYIKLDYVARKYNLGCDKPDLLYKPGFYNRQVRAYLNRIFFNHDTFEQVIKNIYKDIEYAFVTKVVTVDKQALEEWKLLLKQYLFYDEASTIELDYINR